MGRFLTLMTLMILGAVAVRTQQEKPNPYLTQMTNGVSWREGSYAQNLFYGNGAADGFIWGVFYIWRSQRGECNRSVYAAIPAWVDSKNTVLPL